MKRWLSLAAVAVVACKGADGATGPTGPAGAQGPAGTPGAAGAAGATWLSGTAAPTASQGAEGDFYFRISTGEVFRKTSGAWTLITNLTGAQGPQGATGAQGPVGAAGPQGPAGPAGQGTTRLVFTGTLTANSSTSSAAGRDLPSGLTFTSPPVVQCYYQDPTFPNFWWNVGEEATTSTASWGCILAQASPTSPLHVTMLASPRYVGAQYMIVVVY